jgi:hypothetical protein
MMRFSYGGDAYLARIAQWVEVNEAAPILRFYYQIRAEDTCSYSGYLSIGFDSVTLIHK